MPAVADTDGGFSVAPDSLTAAAARVRAASGQAREAVAAGSLNACVVTGSPELDVALSEFDLRWSTTTSRICDAGDDLAAALSSASVAYVTTDACAVPGP